MTSEVRNFPHLRKPHTRAEPIGESATTGWTRRVTL